MEKGPLKRLTTMKMENGLQEQVNAKQAAERHPETILDASTEDKLARAALRASTSKPHDEPKASAAMSACLDAKMAEDLPLTEVVTQQCITKSFEDVREPVEAIRARIASSGRGTPRALALPHAGNTTFIPLDMMVRQQAFGFKLMLDALQMQCRFIDIWRPRHQ